MSIRVVCFDLGGVVIRTCRCWSEACVAAGVDVRGNLDDLWARTGNGWETINDEYQCGRMSTEAFAGRCAELLGGVYSVQEIIAVHRAWTQREYPGVCALIGRIHDAGVETAVLSNTCAVHWPLLHEEPALKALRNRHASHLLGLRKPDPAIYTALERQVGASGSSIVFFDDLPGNVRAARDAGWQAHVIDPEGDTARQMQGVLQELGVLSG